MQLNELRDNAGARRPRKRVGRGMGSGTGKTSGHGQKGQKARSGVAIKGFEGGQMPLQRRLPKRGFVHAKPAMNVLNLVDLEKACERKRFDAKKKVTSEVLATAGIIKDASLPLRILARGELKTKLEIEATYFTKGAVAAIEKAGGKAVVAEGKKAKA